MTGRIAASVAAAALLMAGCSSSRSTAAAPSDSDPSAHRAAIERVLGHSIADWTEYEAAVAEVCALDVDAFDLVVAHNVDAGTVERFTVGIRYDCPSRMGEVDRVLRSLGA